MTPALTVAEWMVIRHRRNHKPIGGKVRGYVDAEEWSEEIRHAVAAQCLFDVPFGFTHEDVDHLKRMAERSTWDEPEIDNYDAEWLRSLADRIAALLPAVKGASPV